jgi:hypothetical protein
MRNMHVQRFAQVFGAVYLLVGLLGLAFNINQPDNALHLASAALGLYFGLAGRRTVASTA